MASWYGPGFHGKNNSQRRDVMIQNPDDGSPPNPARSTPSTEINKMMENRSEKKQVTTYASTTAGRYVEQPGSSTFPTRCGPGKIDMVDAGWHGSVSSWFEVKRRFPAGRGPELFTVQLASYNQRSQAEEFASDIRGASCSRPGLTAERFKPSHFGR